MRRSRTPTLRRVIPTLLVLLLGAALRFHALGIDTRFHPDEALFATFARSAALNGDWLLPGALDKPPLTIYTSALFMALLARSDLTPGLPDITLRAGEFAARFPNVLASVALLALIYGLARRLYAGRGVALLAMLLLALSPFAVTFSATAFTDGLMLFWLAAALWIVSARRYLVGGVYLALAFAAKQQAVFYLPLLMALAWAQDDSTSARIVVMRMFAPLLAMIALLLAWDAARAQETSMWALAAQNNDPFRLLRADEVLPRLSAWLAHGGALLGAGWQTAVLLLMAVGAALWRIAREARQRSTLIDIVLLTYALAYLLLHWLVAFNTYDRYLLPLLPIVVLLAARGIEQCAILIKEKQRERETERFFSVLSPHHPALVLILLVVVLLPAAWDASDGRANVGGDQGEHEGIDAVAAYLDSRALGAIIYDHWLGWELGYYMGQWTDKRRVYYPTPQSLAVGAARQPDPAPRYLVAPADEPLSRWLRALENTGFRATLAYDDSRFVVYELLPSGG